MEDIRGAGKAGEDNEDQENEGKFLNYKFFNGNLRLNIRNMGK